MSKELDDKIREILKDTCHSMSGTPMNSMAGWGFGIQIPKVKELIADEVEAFAERLKKRATSDARDWHIVSVGEIDTELSRYRKGEL